MNRPLLVAIVGVLVVIAAIVLNFTLENPEDSPSEVADTSAVNDAALSDEPGGPVLPSFYVVRIDP